MNETMGGDRPAGEPAWNSTSLNERYDGPLESCPFCGSNDVRQYGHSYSHHFAFACATCGGHGPQRMSPALAAEAWNSRGDDQKRNDAFRSE